MGVIVWVSTFGPKAWLPLWWDIAVVAAFSLMIYYWAMSVALPREEIEEMIEEVVIPEEEGLAAPVG
jgi:hypothetical protein